MIVWCVYCLVVVMCFGVDGVFWCDEGWNVCDCVLELVVVVFVY